MSRGVELPILLPWLTFFACWAILGALVVLAHRFTRGWLRRLDPAQRAGLLFRMALMPFVISCVVTFLSFGPGVGGLTVGNHCHGAADCLRHIPVFCTSLVHTMLLTAGPVLLGAFVIATRLVTLNRSISLNRTLSRIADMHADGPRAQQRCDDASGPVGPFKVIEVPHLFAYCAGFIRGRLIVSRGLVSALTASELAAVVAHEQAHADRRDNARRILAIVGLWLVPQRWTRSILRDLALACETVCDREAARRTGSIQNVVDAVRAIIRLKRPVVESLGAAFVVPGASTSLASDLDARISEMLDQSRKPLPRLLPTAFTSIVYFYAAIALTEVTHHGIELLLA